MEYKWVDPIHVLRYGCTPTLVLCRQLGTLGLAALNLDEYMKPRLGRNILKLMSRCMEKSAKLVMKKRQFR